MPIQSDDLPANIDDAKTYIIKGKTLSKLVKKAKHKFVFAAADFTTTEDDNKTTISISAAFRSACCSGAGGGV